MRHGEASGDAIRERAEGAVPGRLAGVGIRTLALFAALLAVILYAPTLGFKFLNWDDSGYVYGNPNLGRFDWRFVKWAFSSTEALHWSPLLWLSFGVDRAIWGLRPAGYHLSNVLLYGMNVYLVVLLAHNLFGFVRPGGEENRWLAAGAGLLFAVHPLHVEAVAWISSRKDVLYALFYLGSLLAYTSFAASEGSRRKRLYALSLLAFVASLMSKPMAVSLPAIILVLDLYPLKRIRSASALLSVGLLEKLPFYAASLAFSFFTFSSWHFYKSEQADRVVHEVIAPRAMRIWEALYAAAYYVWKAFLPVGLSAYHPMPQAVEATRTTHPLALAALLLVTGVVLLLIRRAPGLATAWTCYLLTIFPTLGIFNVFGYTNVADRFVYLGLLALILPLVSGVGALWARAAGWRKAVLGCLCLLSLLALAGLTVRQSTFWRDSVTFWSRNIEQNPDDYAAMQSLGNAYNHDKEFESAARWFSRSIARFSYSAEAYQGLGIALRGLGRSEEALQNLDKAVFMQAALYGMGKAAQDRRNLIQLYRTRFEVLGTLGRYREAVEDFLRMAELSGKVPRALVLEGRRMADAGRPDQAFRIFSQSLAPAAQ